MFTSILLTHLSSPRFTLCSFCQALALPVLMHPHGFRCFFLYPLGSSLTAVLLASFLFRFFHFIFRFILIFPYQRTRPFSDFILLVFSLLSPHCRLILPLSITHLLMYYFHLTLSFFPYSHPASLSVPIFLCTLSTSNFFNMQS